MRFTILSPRANAKQDDGTWGIVDARDDTTGAKMIVKSSFWPLPSFTCVSSGMTFEADLCREHHPVYGDQLVAFRPICLNTHHAVTVSALITSFPSRPKWLLRVLSFCKLNLHDALIDVENGAPVTVIGLKNEKSELGFAKKLLAAFTEYKMVIDLCSQFPALPVKVAMSLEAVSADAISMDPWVLARTHKIEREPMLPIADQIGIGKLGRAPNDPLRLRAYISAAYKELTEDASIGGDDVRGMWNDDQGSTWLAKRVFVQHTNALLNQYASGTPGLGAAAVSADLQVLFDPATTPGYLKSEVDDETGESIFTLETVDRMERELAHALMRPRHAADATAVYAVNAFERLASMKSVEEEEVVEAHAEQRRDIEAKLDLTLPNSRWREVFALYQELDATQRSSVRLLVERRLLLLVGGAGTGKTRTLACCIRFLVDILGEETRALALMGKAAVRIQQTLGTAVERITCRTIHSEVARKFRDTPSYAVDEVGTCPSQLLHRLIVNLPIRCYLVLCGDDKQLPSIQPGMLLKDMLFADNALPTVRLERIHRNAEGSEIASSAPTIFSSGNGQLAVAERSGEFAVKFLNVQTQLDAAVGIFTQLHASGSQVQMLTNTNSSAEEANRLLQPIVLPDAARTTESQRLERKYGPPFVCNDRVVCTETVEVQEGEARRIYNGTLGSVCEIDTAGKTFGVVFDCGSTRTYPAATRAIRHAYCLTVHRSQGSEYECAVVLFTSSWALSKNLIYTAVTRAQRSVALVTSRSNFSRALCTEIHRTTRLGIRLREESLRQKAEHEARCEEEEIHRVQKWARVGGGSGSLA